MRRPLGKKIRFEVLKRDSFTCRYCGRKAPDTVLHVDHVVSVVDGGDDAEDNLATSCADCNLGKGADSRYSFRSVFGVLDDEQAKAALFRTAQDKLGKLDRELWDAATGLLTVQETMIAVYRADSKCELFFLLHTETFFCLGRKSLSADFLRGHDGGNREDFEKIVAQWAPARKATGVLQ